MNVDHVIVGVGPVVVGQLAGFAEEVAHRRLGPLALNRVRLVATDGFAEVAGHLDRDLVKGLGK